MIQCCQCHDTNGPFVVDSKRGNRLFCENCYYINQIRFYAALYFTSNYDKPKEVNIKKLINEIKDIYR